MPTPKQFLIVEGATVLLAACVLYHETHGSWLWFVLLFLAPDISMLGYLAGNKAGAVAYNFAHTYTVPLVLTFILWVATQTPCLWLPLIWLAHIGFDRFLGYGLKYETAFKDTHLQKV